ncbi:MAG: hypothetical protein IT319_03280, partial [Anaerolineae bacterium]|nr:hypothetical protein [Anaerolineae bacterium]
QRRVASGRTAPKARFTRRQRSGSLPPPLLSGRERSIPRSVLTFVLAVVIMVCVGVMVVIGVGMVTRAQQQYDDMQWRASAYGRPTLPFSTPVPNESNVESSISPASTMLPPVINPALSVASSASVLTEPLGSANGDQATLTSFCDQFGIPVSIRIFDWNDWSTVDLPNPLVAQMPISWDASGDLWRGYGVAKPFDQPDDTRDRWRLTLFTAEGVERWIYVAQSDSTPDTLYAYAYQNINPFADANGNHYGYHPCRAFALPATQMDVLLSSARAYRSSGSRFPEFAAPDDPRWVSGSAIPLAGSFEVRTVPTRANNSPIQIVASAINGYFIVEADWGTWVQVKIGNTTAWVDTSTVRLETGS